MATNPYVNKVTYDGSDLIDLTQDTVSQSDVLLGIYFHLPTGERVQGSVSLATATVTGTTLYLTNGFPVSA